MKIDLANWEVMNLLKNGSTNQQEIYKTLSNESSEIEEMFFYYVENLEEITGIKDDLRSLINGGVLRISEEKEFKGDALYLRLTDKKELFIEIL